MDTSDAAALAALVVAILAIFVAILQAVQQYLLTGALIRLCDSVVFGKMPGRGRRVWEMSQFRFRVVYSIPQVSLHRDLWPGSLPHIPSYAKGSRSLPDLGLLEAKDDNSSSVQEGPWKAGSPANSVSFSPGEASWVSFCRAVQLSSGRSMVLDLVAGDADRCPSDLPNVPMPMSMRDIAVMGLMTGMKCTQASFEAKSLSMQGLVGTITTSQHPFLGPLLHFSPRNMSVNEIQDLQIGGGAVDPFWMSRMWDEVNVAGRRYTQDQRMKIEKDEASWARSLRERAVVPMSRNRSPPPSSLSGLRRRRSAGPELTKSSDTVVSSQSPEKQNGSGFVSSCKDDSCRTLWTRSDGDWSVDNRATVVDDTPNMVAQTIDTCQKTPPLRIKDKVKRHRRALLAQTWNIVFYKRHHSSKKTLDDPFNAELELGGTRVTPGVVPNPQRNMQDQNSGNRRNTQDQGANLPPRWWISNYIKEKRQVIEGDILENERPKGPLLIGWYDEDDQGIPELNEAEENIAKSVLEMWTRSRSDLESQRAAFYASRWRNVIQRRQMNREDRSRSRRAPARSSQRARTRSDSGRRYRSPDEKVPNQSLAESRRHYELRVPYYPPVYDDEAGTRSQAGYYQTNSPNIYARPSAPESGSRPRMPRDRGQYSESNVEDETVHRQSRPRSRVRSRPNDKVFEYGDGGIAGRIPEAWLNQKSPENSTSKSPVSPALDNSNERKPTNRVGFGPTIDVIDAPSSDEDANEDSKKTLPAEKESQEWEFVTPAQQFRLDYPHLSIPPSALSPRTDPGREVSPPPRQSYFPAHRRPSSPSSSSISPRTSSGRAISPPPRQSGSSAEKPKGILKPPRATFPEEANPIREGVAPLRDRKLPDEIPAGARWTKIDRRLVDVEALEAGNERFEERSDHVIVLRVLSKEEIQRYAVKTQEIRGELFRCIPMII
ncbi:hypothetical protein N7532_009464 [Penicillium argentinense]|uniref:DUF8035 domain-containing protein n=1 Tax=Penicillium argentinense TaxID=1131581 RepID=A0A9W9K2W1_9EURO|nr:uncharacterized protein N7532_009464 [Penicillium argentinense]KAJ5090780.1 hypothetical protein N7532_009464 [Penicillium argentinense]